MKGVCGGEYVPEECSKCKKRKLCAEKEQGLAGEDTASGKISKKKKAG